MASQMKQARNAGQSQRFRFVVLLIGCFLVSMTFLVVSRPQSFFAGRSSEETNEVQRLDDVERRQLQIDTSTSDFSERRVSQTTQLPERNEDKEEIEKEKTEQTMPDSVPKEEKPVTDVVVVDKDEASNKVETEEEAPKQEEPSSEQNESQSRLTLPTVSNYTISDSVQETPQKNTSEVEKPTLPQLGGQITFDRKPLCDNSDFRVDICDMDGDIRIASNSSTIIFKEEPDQLKQESWQLHPYPRKGDNFCFDRVREITVKSSSEAPQCTVYHDVPAIFFSIGGYAGNLFHDFTDLLIPLFLTARQYDGEVKFVVADYNPYWIYKYILFFQKMSKYPVIDYEKDKGVHCFKHVVVGLRCHKELSIDPSRAPNGLSMVDFTRFMRTAYSLERETTTNIEDLQGKKPRLLIIARKRTRAFTNLGELVQLAEGLGFEVIVDEADLGSDMAKFAQLVNSVDVFLGVHGAGLTNMVFLPVNATVIQVVPWGDLEGIAMYDFGGPAKDMKLNYMQYSIGIEESTLTEHYPRDHVVFTDPHQIHKQGFGALRSIFMDKQNVKLDVKKFRSTLWKALEHIII